MSESHNDDLVIVGVQEMTDVLNGLVRGGHAFHENTVRTMIKKGELRTKKVLGRHATTMGEIRRAVHVEA